MRESFDVVILGCGEAGIFAAYELEKLNPGLKLLAIDQGPDIYHRSCPIVSGKCASASTVRSATRCAASAARARSPTASSTSRRPSAAG